MLVPYFIVMVILAFYGIHRYQLCGCITGTRRTRRSGTSPAAVCRGPFAVRNDSVAHLQRAVCDRPADRCDLRLEYPRDRFEVQLLDDSTDETIGVAQEIVDRYARGFAGIDAQPIVHLHRTKPAWVQGGRAG